MPLLCYRCGHDLAELTLPLSRLDLCPSCSTELHVCRLCGFYDPAVAKSCREDDADEVKEKSRANFCDYFKPAPDRYDAAGHAASTSAAAAAEALFEDAEPEAAVGNPISAAEDLFRK